MKESVIRLLLSMILLIPAQRLPANSPNIILILTDDQGWSQLSARMDPRVPESCSAYLETPNMARLARGGMRMTSGYSPAPLCTPTRRSILCGTSAARSGTEFKSDWVPAEHMTIPKALKLANPAYRCAHFGKWGEQMISTPAQCGYDTSDGETGNVTGGMPSSLGIASGSHADGPPHFIDNEDPKRTKSIILDCPNLAYTALTSIVKKGKRMGASE
jgi:arylsulfatase A-like enzyme